MLSRSIRTGSMVAWVGCLGLSFLPCLGETKSEPRTGKATLRPRVRVETSMGPFVIELDGEKAPGSTLNFVQYVRGRFYEGTIFHRVISGFMIQGGSHKPDLSEKLEGLQPPIKNEWRNRLRNRRGTVALARLGNQPQSGRASFYINVADNPLLDKPMDGAAYAVFGQVIEGMDVVDQIQKTPVRADEKLSSDKDRAVVPVDPVVIRSVELLDPLDESLVQEKLRNFDEWVRSIESRARTATVDAIQERVDRLEKEYSTKFTVTESGLRYIDVQVGGGTSPMLDDTVLVHYLGTFADGTEFDNSRTNPDLLGGPAKFRMTNLIQGWTEGMRSMKVGGRRILVIPPELGYADRGRKSIPPNSTLFYDIEFIGFAQD